jgi:hypothetical protein
VAIAFVRVGARAAASPVATIAPAKPAVDGIGGILLCNVTSKNNAAHATATPGWSMLGTQKNSGASFTSSLWIAAEGAAAPTFTWTGSVAASAQIAYYEDINRPLDPTVAAISSTTGTGNPHTSTSINSTRPNSTIVYVDVCSTNSAIATPVGWTEDVDAGSVTDGGRTAWGEKALGASGSASGAISVTGATGAWVQWQVEIRATDAGALVESKAEVGAWIDGSAGYSKLEVGAWLDAGQLGESKLEVGAWLDAGQFQVSKGEVGAWVDVGVPSRGRRMSLM